MVTAGDGGRQNIFDEFPFEFDFESLHSSIRKAFEEHATNQKKNNCLWELLKSKTINISFQSHLTES